MKANKTVLTTILTVTWAAITARATTLSLTGTLPTPEDIFTQTITLASAGNVTLQTYGFGGGTNAANQPIAAGGFDSFVGIFSGTGPSSVYVNGVSDSTTNYTAANAGCPPAGTLTVGTVPGVCGDVVLTENLSPGTYTVLLSDANYQPIAEGETNGTLGDGFVDLTGGAFQTCVTLVDCNTDDGNWALDITFPGGSGSTSPTPEPATFCIAGLALLLFAFARRSARALPAPLPQEAQTSEQSHAS